MPITDPRAITFSNTRVRPFADLLSTAYGTAKDILSQWNAQNMSTLITNTALIIEDGASVDGTDAVGGDGRPLMTGAAATNLITRAQDLVNWMEGSTSIAAGDGTKAVLNTVLAVKVNGNPLY